MGPSMHWTQADSLPAAWQAQPHDCGSYVCTKGSSVLYLSHRHDLSGSEHVACACAGSGLGCSAQRQRCGLRPCSLQWTAAYTAYPQTPAPSIVDVFTCVAPYALCAYANCSVVPGTTPLVAECGCVAYPDAQGLSLGNVPYMLDAQYKVEASLACGGTLGLDVPCVLRPNTAAFCRSMQLSPNETVPLYGGSFGLVSTFAPDWPQTSGSQGERSPPTYCESGFYTNCFSAACNVAPSWNGLNAACYCPVYNATGFFLLGAARDGYSCSGQSAGGKVAYVQNGT